MGRRSSACRPATSAPARSIRSCRCGVDIWAALRTLGRSGVAELVNRCCAHAQTFARELSEGGCTIHNDVVLNQIIVSFGGPDTTRKVIAAVQSEGTLWFGPTVWQGVTAARISASSWATTEEDVRKSVEAILRIRDAVEG